MIRRKRDREKGWGGRGGQGKGAGEKRRGGEDRERGRGEGGEEWGHVSTIFSPFVAVSYADGLRTTRENFGRTLLPKESFDFHVQRIPVRGNKTIRTDLVFRLIFTYSSFYFLLEGLGQNGMFRVLVMTVMV